VLSNRRSQVSEVRGYIYTARDGVYGERAPRWVSAGTPTADGRGVRLLGTLTMATKAVCSRGFVRPPGKWRSRLRVANDELVAAACEEGA
jgi:hypothetical protein